VREAKLGPFEYLLIFLSIVLGLAVSDLCISLNRLLGAGAKVRWDWLAPMAAVVAFLKIITQWWAWFGASQFANGLTFEMFVLLVVAVVLLFLLAAAALPDSADEHQIDLRAYYAQVARRYWLLVAAHYLVTDAVNLWVRLQVAGAGLTADLALLLFYPAAALALAFVRSRFLHAVCLALLIGLYLFQSAGRALGH
jgi:hypothetical protein